MPCSNPRHGDIFGMGICPSQHVNRFCAEHSGQAQQTPAKCKDCGGALKFTSNDSEMRAASLHEHNARLQAAQRPQPMMLGHDAPKPKSKPEPKLKVPSSVAEDLGSERWTEARKLHAARKKNTVVEYFAKAGFTAFRKRYGLWLDRLDGIGSDERAVRAAFRVTVDDGKPTDHARPPSQPIVTTAQRGLMADSFQEPEKARVGYLAMVPLPLMLDDAVGADRHPLVLAEMYTRMFKLRDVAWRRVRILFAINLRDDYRHRNDSTAKVVELMQVYVAALNQAFIDQDLPARAVGVVWGSAIIKPPSPQAKAETIIKPFAHVVPVNLDPSSKVALSTDEIRKQLPDAARGASVQPPGTEFPFATFRSLLVQCPEATRMIKELEVTCDNVFLHTGDGDAVTFEFGPDMSLYSIFDSEFQSMEKAAIGKLARLGGCTSFDEKEVGLQLLKLGIFTGPSDLAFKRSVLLTMLAKTLDSAVRGVLDIGLPGCGYFAEPNTLLNAKLITLLDLKNVNNETNGSMPDWQSLITAKLKALGGGWTQKILPSYGHQLVTSARAALVVLCDGALPADVELVRVRSNFNLVQVIQAFLGEHNTQLKESQVASRLAEMKCRLPVGGPLRSQLPRRADYPEELPLHMVPGVALSAIWKVELGDEVSALWQDFPQDEGLEIMLAKVGFKYARLSDEICGFNNGIDILPDWGWTRELYKLLVLTLRRQTGLAKPTDTEGIFTIALGGESDDEAPAQDPADEPVYYALILLDMVCRWGLSMAHRIMKLERD
ncbi:MAG: hypothetical protein IT370_21450 [Deltaproteobacteria bacterium]|nr:hypothetical protein [Deltaproteobacteria bacterium]